ncbi:hypothetical protein EV421DRAFT_1388238 [Armillaria borealis]|uniref:Uncharacterized protein n=1 Tax=Armillaria borealis TaxID=47425 RepID=A0AA39J1Q4_9AGAR|nr:hypothetical protein EV421DRAFT_1388238 [Armillaria borealis]
MTMCHRSYPLVCRGRETQCWKTGRRLRLAVDRIYPTSAIRGKTSFRVWFLQGTASSRLTCRCGHFLWPVRCPHFWHGRLRLCHCSLDTAVATAATIPSALLDVRQTPRCQYHGLQWRLGRLIAAGQIQIVTARYQGIRTNRLIVVYLMNIRVYLLSSFDCPAKRRSDWSL